MYSIVLCEDSLIKQHKPMQKCDLKFIFFPDELPLEFKRILPPYRHVLCTKMVNYF